tara:strand:+ start:318 stop:713 length:396 start_codon:yes stop_codon:yes gene_type:complete
MAAHEWTAEQEEVLAFQIHCQSTQDADEWMECFHDDFKGLGMNLGPMPTNKNDRRNLDSANRATFARELILLKPLSIYVNGNFAIVNYVVQQQQTNKKTGEETIQVSRWMDVLLKDNGKWSWISDHGVNGP